MKKDMEKYYENEYSMLKDAHFQISKQITSFFQFSLLIFSAPFALLSIDSISVKQIGAVFVIIGIVSQLVMCYLTKMRCEALLYARQINKIRNVLYSGGIIGSDYISIHRNRMMLSQENKPEYSDKNQFRYIVYALNVMSSFYLTFGLYRLSQGYSNCTPLFKCAVNHFHIFPVISVFVFFVGLVAYRIITIQAENGTDYYKRNIGIDIDGVLNKHEEQFVKVYNELFNADISINDIKTLPVHEFGNISQENEQKVFMQNEYWSEMPAIERAADIINNEIHNKLGFQIYIFTWREWNIRSCKRHPRINIIKTIYNNFIIHLSRHDMKMHTKQWLNEKSFHYRKVKFEYGNVDRPISAFSLKYRTRSYYAQKLRIKYFVEDNVENAIKLSKTCDYVFLYTHLYNEKYTNLPYNIIRVESWNEVLTKIKELD